MRWVCLVALFGVACTKPNPAKYCQDGTCTTPDYPFCDMSGFVSGEPGTCIAVTCTPGQFGECRGDLEVRCNSSGANYDVVQCERGCDASADGCRLCSPNETACTNGTVATCDASGAVVSKEPCPLGCFESEPRCREIVPSNGLATLADTVMNPPDLDLSTGSWVVVTSTGEIRSGATTLSIPNFHIAAPPNGVATRLFVAGRVRLGDVVVQPTNSGFEEPGPAIAILATRDITIDGTLRIMGGTGGAQFAPCSGGSGRAEIRNTTQCLLSAPGGGAHATNGGKGGDIGSVLGGGAAGMVMGTAALVPLRGGCASGSWLVNGTEYVGGMAGGGAIQLTSRTQIVVNGTIDANGVAGDLQQIDCGFGSFGGSGGGGILLESPAVNLQVGAQLLARGGDGSQACQTAGTYCGAKGIGATSTNPAQAGSNSGYTASGQDSFVSGGGGGGLGRIRINTADGDYTKSTSSLEDGVLTTGVLETR